MAINTISNKYLSYLTMTIARTFAQNMEFDKAVMKVQGSK